MKKLTAYELKPKEGGKDGELFDLLRFAENNRMGVTTKALVHITSGNLFFEKTVLDALEELIQIRRRHTAFMQELLTNPPEGLEDDQANLLIEQRKRIMANIWEAVTQLEASLNSANLNLFTEEVCL